MAKKNDQKKDPEKKTFDFRECREEISIGVFAKSDLSKTLANYIYQHTSDIGSAEFARELFHKGYVTIDEQTKENLMSNIIKSTLIVSVKRALLDVLNGSQQ